MTTTIDPNLLAEAGVALYGPSWHGPLADDLGVNLRTMRRWAAGKMPVPTNIVREILALLQALRGSVCEIENKLLALDLGEPS